MAWPTVATPANANRIAATVQSVYIRPTGELYQTLGAIKAGAEVVIEDYQEKDSNGKNKAIASKTVTAKITMLQASLTEIELLDTLVAGTSSFLFKMSDAASIPTGGAAATVGWWLFSSTQIGVKPKIVYSGDVEKSGMIELEFSGSLQNSEVDAAIKASIDDDEFEATGGSGTFRTLGTYTAAKDGGRPTMANMKSCGISSLTIADTGGAAQTLGPIDEPTIEFSYWAEMDSLKIFRSRGVLININYHWKQTDSTNLLNLDTFADEEVDVVVTMKSGLIMTLTNKVGIGARLQAMGDYEKTRSIVFKHEGSVGVADIDGIFSV